MDGPLDMSALSRRAADGDAEAQYALAAVLSRAGKRAEAERLLQSAAQSGYADALFTLATRQLNSSDGAAAAASGLERAAAGGSTAAARLLAVLRAMGVGAVRDETAALKDVINLARAGDAAAQREVAALLALSDSDDQSISPLIEASSRRDVVAAAFWAARASEKAQNASTLAASISLLKKAGYPRVRELTAGLKNNRANSASTTIDWVHIEAAATLTPPLRVKEDRLCDSPDAIVYRSAVAPEICEYLIAHAASRLGPSLVYDPVNGGMMRDPLRTSATASLSPIDLDLALVALNRLIAAAAREADENGEFLSVLHYAPGQQYRPHLDCIPAGPDLDASGQRVKTAILFLNDDYEGGETHFLAPDLRFRGHRGDLLVFSNVDGEGAPDKASRHAGLPVAAGRKWIVTRWFRGKKFAF